MTSEPLDDGPSVLEEHARPQLSGWLPDRRSQGMDTVLDKLLSGFEHARHTGDTTSEHTRVIGIVVLEAVSAKYPKLDAKDPSPVIGLRVVKLEPVTDPDAAAELRRQMLDLQAERLGEQPLPGIDDAPGRPEPEWTDTPAEPLPDGERPATGGEATNGSDSRKRRDRSTSPVTAVPEFTEA